MYEYAGNLHNHTPYSDGVLYHADLAQAALRAGLDFLLVTDHNIWVDGVQGYYAAPSGKKLLLLTGEEMHHMQRQPQASHLLVYGVKRELAAYTPDPQTLIDTVNAAGGLAFLAHPYETAAPRFGEAAYSWEDWQVHGFAGLEIWNYMSEFKSLMTSVTAAARYAYFPEHGISGPPPAALNKWDALLATGRQVTAIGGADAHGQTYNFGPLRRCVFPYEQLYRAVNTHVLLPQPLCGDWLADELAIYAALRAGACFVGYDQPAATRGFRFSATAGATTTNMGAQVRLPTAAALQLHAHTPALCNLRLLHNGTSVASAVQADALDYTVSVPGVYRIEASIKFHGRMRAWIFSNPIYVRE
jgi:hypothetical protein